MRILFISIFLTFFCLLSVSPAMAADNNSYDRCRSYFDDNPEMKKQADSASPLVMAVFGDSILWGQGLKERDKFWCRTKQWLEMKTRRNVVAHVYAHAGAIIDESSLKSTDLEMLLKIPPQGGEVNVSFPTITQQVEKGSAELKASGVNVDLILVDGCVNDVNVRNFLNAENTPGIIQELTRKRCGEPMENLLTRIASEFKNAQIIVTGYYPIIYKGLIVEENGRKKQVVKGTANNQLTKLAITQLGGGKDIPPACADDLRDCLGPLSRAWYETSTATLSDAVNSVNQKLLDAAPRIRFAEMSFPPEYGFSTKQSLLWNLRFGATNTGGFRKVVNVALDLFKTLDTNDDQWDLRGEQCKKTEQDFSLSLKQLKKTDEKEADRLKNSLKYFELVCRRASIGHPNKYGALLYTQTIIGHLQPIITEKGWMRKD